MNEQNRPASGGGSPKTVTTGSFRFAQAHLCSASTTLPVVLPHLRMLPAILRMIVPAVSDGLRAGGTDGRRSGRPEVYPGPEARRGAWRAPVPSPAVRRVS